MTAPQPNPAMNESADVVTPLYCANHPDTETYLRCNKCGKPICLKCAVLTEVGYRCKECIRQQQNVFYNAATTDNLIAFAVAAGITLIAWPLVAWLFRLTGFFGWILAVLIGSGAGASLAQIIRKSVGRRRGRYIRHFTLAGIIVGLILSGLLTSLIFSSFLSFFSLGGLLFLILVIATAYQTLR
ncbi:MULTISPECIES: B-box zinc finger protein [Caldilinea]|jgi:hypothetical protein|uniref:B box-type domain-containing protein n=1 Tax=Caldilinea aerophila (strain DSM 14535 / JCM 11387 / NBRC 104270 / STL-6-O1) TaxID=926550 RepID=I0I2M8_CALAS|nr:MULTISPECIES: hypothetical protein [Caldilinea]BAL99515.1 hypothetical protein CLDAP_14760 [Caldilinea aerophila DSM 14535 = NBRC 104270]GIV73890.1 MAG: hypothetical protein KatS3mg049_2446 [Caldilinea sp.]